MKALPRQGESEKAKDKRLEVMIMLKKCISLMLVLAMILCADSALAENIKHERVYIVADAEGTVRSLTDSIRLENKDALDVLTDRTLLTAIENVSGSEAFTLDGETLTWQAAGKDITYQGFSDKTPVLLPRVTLTLDGAPVSAADLAAREGEATLTVEYPVSEPIPALALSLMILPDTGLSAIRMENASLLSVLGRQVLVGWALPGADDALGLPSSFTVSFHADHAVLNWMMTFSTSDPIDLVCKELESRITVDAHTELENASSLLTALRDGKELPEINGIAQALPGTINELNDGLAQLDDGAKQLADGTKELASGAGSLKEGAAALDEGVGKLQSGTVALTLGANVADQGAGTLLNGLNTLVENNDALNQGAAQLFDAILASANQQLAGAGLEALGITLPALTRENYEEILSGVLEKLDPKTMKSAYDQLSALKDSLDQVNQFVSGLSTYTAGVSQAASGAATLKAGTAQLASGVSDLSAGVKTLKEGSAALSDGAGTLYDGSVQLQDGAAALRKDGTMNLKIRLTTTEKIAAGMLLPIVEKDLTNLLRLYEETRDHAAKAGYDLRPEGMQTITVYIIRTDLQ